MTQPVSPVRLEQSRRFWQEVSLVLGLFSVVVLIIGGRSAERGRKEGHRELAQALRLYRGDPRTIVLSPAMSENLPTREEVETLNRVMGSAQPENPDAKADAFLIQMQRYRAEKDEADRKLLETKKRP